MIKNKEMYETSLAFLVTLRVFQLATIIKHGTRPIWEYYTFGGVSLLPVIKVAVDNPHNRTIVGHALLSTLGYTAHIALNGMSPGERAADIALLALLVCGSVYNIYYSCKRGGADDSAGALLEIRTELASL